MYGRTPSARGSTVHVAGVRSLEVERPRSPVARLGMASELSSTAPPSTLVVLAGAIALFVLAVTAVHQFLLLRHRLHHERWHYTILSMVPLVISSGCFFHIVTYDGAPVISKGWGVFRNLIEACGLLLFHSLLLSQCGGGVAIVAALDGVERKHFVTCLAPCAPCARCCTRSAPFTERSLHKCWMLSKLYVLFELVALCFVAGCQLAALARGERCEEGCVPQLVVACSTLGAGVGVALSLHGIAVVFVAARPLLSKHSRLGRKFVAIKLLVVVATVQEIVVKAVEARGGDFGRPAQYYSPAFATVYLENALLAFECVPRVLLTAWAYQPSELEYALVSPTPDAVDHPSSEDAETIMSRGATINSAAQHLTA